MPTSPVSADHAPRRVAYTRWLLAALLVGAIVRVLLAVGDDVITNDATAYLRSGTSVWEGHGFRREGHPELHFPPAYPVLLGGAAELLDDPQQAMVLVTLLSSIAILIPLASLGRRLGGDRAGLAAVWVGALVPGLTDVPVSSGSGNEVVFLLAVLLSLRLALVAHDRTGAPRQLAALGAGLLAGLAYLTRPEGLLYAVVAAAVLIGPLVLRRACDWRPRLAATAVLCLGLAVAVVPYASYLHHNTGKWELTAKANDASIASWRAVAEHDREARDAIIYALDPSGTSFVANRASLAALAKEDPSGYLGILRINARELWHEVAVPVERQHRGLGWSLVPLPVSALALWGAWRRWRRGSVLLLVTALLAPTATALGFFVQARYLIPATAFICLLVGVAFAELPRRLVRPAALVTAVLLGLSLAAAADGSDGWFNRKEPVEQRLVGQWLAEHTGQDARIMTRSMIVEYYADRRAVPIPYAEQAAVLKFAAHHGVDYFVVDEYGLTELRPQLLGLLDGPPPQGARVVYSRTQHGRRVLVLQLDHSNEPETASPPGIGFMGDG